MGFTLADSEILLYNTVNSSTHDLLLVWGILKPHHVYNQIMTTVSSAVTHPSFSFISVLACLETHLNHSHSPHSFYLVLYSGQRSILSCCNVFPLHFQHVHVHIYRRDATHCANFPTSGWKLEDSSKTKELTNNAKLFLVLYSSCPALKLTTGNFFLRKKWLFFMD